MNFLAYLGQNIYYFIAVFLVFVSVFFYVRFKFKEKSKNSHRIKKRHQATPTIYGGSTSNNGIIFISKPIKPYGHKTTMNYDVASSQDVRNIFYKGVFDVKVIINKDIEKEEVIIKGDEAFVELIELEFVNETLNIKHKQISCNYELDCKIFIYLNDLERFYNKGQGEIEIVGINNDKITVFHFGIQDFYISGKTKELVISNSAKGSIYAETCKSSIAYLETSNSGMIVANVSDMAHCIIKESGSIKLLNKPVEVIKRVTGKGQLLYRALDETFKDYVDFQLKILMHKIQGK